MDLSKLDPEGKNEIDYWQWRGGWPSFPPNWVKVAQMDEDEDMCTLHVWDERKRLIPLERDEYLVYVNGEIEAAPDKEYVRETVAELLDMQEEE